MARGGTSSEPSADGARAVHGRVVTRARYEARRARVKVLRRLPSAVRRPLQDLALRGSLRFGRGEVVDADAFEEFLVDHLDVADPGSYVEFGVYLGTSITAAVRAFDRAVPDAASRRFCGFDSFEGLPPGSEHEGWLTGDFASSLPFVEGRLRRAGVRDRITLVPGWFDDTCTPATARRLSIPPVAVAMIDCDTYSSTVTSLRFVLPLLAERSIIVFDDWYANNPDGTQLEGQRLAFEELIGTAADIACTDLGRVGTGGRGWTLVRTFRYASAPA